MSKKCIPPMLRGKKMFILQLGNMLSSDVYWPFVTIFFSGQDNFKKQLFGRSIFLQLLWLQEEVQLKFHVKKKTYLTKKMYQILMRTLYEVSWAWVWHQLLLEQFLFHAPVSRSMQIWRRIHCITTLNEILASNDSLLWLEYVVHWEDLWHRNLWHLLYTKL